ncbi:MAG TPA: VOC family protein [Thermoplasmata archaeon]|nr:VOC family protein [Thermoplasmata archaeon]
MEATRTPRLAPYLVVPNARELVRFVEQALGGTLSFEMEGSEGRLEHGELRIADSLVMVADAPPGRAPFPAMLHLYVSDAQASYRRAIAGGATSVREPAMAPDGHLRGGVRDSWGNEWWFSTPRGGL